ncbi:MAG: hypothetical protein J1E61_09985 [Lachnospiraceae bacterium]|nr:hypothetical protein [Lachnospiraceae bacterium]
MLLQQNDALLLECKNASQAFCRAIPLKVNERKLGIMRWEALRASYFHAFF